MYPDERSLVRDFADRPFALLGVNSDRDREAVKKVLVEKKLTWRSWWDGGGTEGPIATQWCVTNWPTIYFIDHQGIIRGRGAYGESNRRTIERLLQEIGETESSPNNRSGDAIPSERR